MSIILINNELHINEKIYTIDLNIDDFISHLETSRFDKEYRNTGRILSINPTLNGYYSNMIISIFWEMYLKNNIFPNYKDMLKIFLEKSIDKSSYPLRDKEYIVLSHEYVEVKLHSLMYKFYKTYFLICAYLYHFLKLREQNLSVGTNFIDFLNIFINDKKYTVSILNNEKETDIKMFEYPQEEDIGDFEFPSDEAYVEIYTNIINNTL